MQHSYSVVIPCYRSQESISLLYVDLSNFFKKNQYDYEIILVDDCSPDETLKVIESIARLDERVKTISFFKNFGQVNAIMAGLAEARKNYVVIMDDDLQNSAEDIQKLISKIDEGYDYVYAYPIEAAQSFWRIYGSMLNNFMAKVVISKPKNLRISSFLIFNASLLPYVLAYQGPYPYLAGLLLRTSRNCANISVNYKKRKFSTSSYTLSKLIRLWVNGFTNFSILPLRFATVTGFIVSPISILCGFWLILQKILHPDMAMGWTSLQVSLMFLSGMIFLFVGILGEYVGRIFMLLNKDPQYAIRRKSNCEK